jgi:CRP/FNR family cyclic AMP-dependent transcriptional regulator
VERSRTSRWVRRPTTLFLTHEEIGNFIGASRETVTRTLGNFKIRNLVAFHGSMMTITNRAALEDYVHA